MCVCVCVHVCVTVCRSVGLSVLYCDVVYIMTFYLIQSISLVSCYLFTSSSSSSSSYSSSSSSSSSFLRCPQSC